MALTAGSGNGLNFLEVSLIIAWIGGIVNTGLHDLQVLGTVILGALAIIVLSWILLKLASR